MQIWAAVLRIWRWLTKPHASLTDSIEQIQARAASSLTLVTNVFLLVLAVVHDIPPTFTFGFALTFALLIGCYVITRSRYFRVGAAITICVLWGFTIAALAVSMSDNAGSQEFVLSLLRASVLSLLITSVVFWLNATVLLVGLLVFGLVVLGSFNPQIRDAANHMLVTTVGFSLVFFVLYKYERARNELTRNALKDSESRYRAIVEDQTELICRWLPDRSLTFVNEAYVRFFERPREEIMGKPVLAYVYPDDAPLVEACIELLTPDNPTVLYEHRVEKHGKIYWLQWVDRAILDTNGKVVEYQAVGRNVTALKQARQAEADERRFAEMLSTNAAQINESLDVNLTMDTILQQAMRLENVSAADISLIDEGEGTVRVARSLGYEDFQMENMVSELIVPLTSFSSYTVMLETQKPRLINDTFSEPTWIRYDEGWWIHAYLGAPIRLEGEIIGFLSVVSAQPNAFTTQTADRLQAFADQAGTAIRNARLYEAISKYAGDLENQVRERTAQLTVTTQRLSAILDATVDGIFYSEGGIIQYVNDGFCRMLGRTDEELLGQVPDLLRIETMTDEQVEVLRRDMQRNLERHGVWRQELPIRRKDDTIFEAAVTVSLVGSVNATPQRTVAVLRDISQEKALEMQRAQFIAHASHELRTPLTNMKTRLYIARHRPEQFEMHLNILDEITDRMTRLVQDLLEMSRMERGLIPMEWQVITAQAIAEAVELMQRQEAERAGLKLILHLHPEPLHLHADRERLIQVITNLVTNAINYTPAGGKIEITVEPDGDADAVIHVHDTGIGIAPENQPFLFQPFYRVPSKVIGTGLGLSIVKQIVGQHGGRVTLESEVGCGSRFSVYLPLLVDIPTLTDG